MTRLNHKKPGPKQPGSFSRPLLICLVWIGMSSFLPHSVHKSQSKGSLTVTVANIKNIKGQIGLCLFSSGDGFPGKAEKAVMRGFVKVTGHTASYTFSGLSPGTYAVSVFHDEDNDKKMNTNFIGLPKEGVGVSNNAKGFFGPPKFDDAKFTYPGGRQEIKIDLMYL